jgi:hypothetical protein
MWQKSAIGTDKLIIQILLVALGLSRLTVWGTRGRLLSDLINADPSPNARLPVSCPTEKSSWRVRLNRPSAKTTEDFSIEIRLCNSSYGFSRLSSSDQWPQKSSSIGSSSESTQLDLFRTRISMVLFSDSSSHSQWSSACGVVNLSDCHNRNED